MTLGKMILYHLVLQEFPVDGYFRNMNCQHPRNNLYVFYFYFYNNGILAQHLELALEILTTTAVGHIERENVLSLNNGASR